MTVFSEWEHGHEEMIKLTYEFMEKADVIVGYNSDKFDIPKLGGRAATRHPSCRSHDFYRSLQKGSRRWDFLETP